MSARFGMVLVLATAVPVTGSAQASIFGTRALGLPVLPLSARAQGMAGGDAMFDADVSLNPAAMWLGNRPYASFTLRQFWRNSENTFGEGSGRDTQFPLAMVTGPVGARFDYAVSVSAYTDRTFALTLADSLLLRDVMVGINDTLVSRGGVTDIRGAVSYTVSSRFAVGVGLHLLTGTNLIQYRRGFSDSSYAPVRVGNELSFVGPGISAGFSAAPTGAIRLAGMVRWDGDLAFHKDSTRLEDVPLPLTMGGGIQIQAGQRLLLAGHALRRNWSVADERIRAEGGNGARSTTEGAAGLQWIRNPRRPAKFPLRAGVRFAQLPFAVIQGQQSHEFEISLGTGFHFTNDRGALDIALQRAWRSDGADFSERTVMLSIGIGVRP